MSFLIFESIVEIKILNNDNNVNNIILSIYCYFFEHYNFGHLRIVSYFIY